MTQIALIGIGAGTASALLFASVASGSVLSIFLFYVSPLPILIAGLGWSHWAAAIASLGAATALALVFGGMFFLGFMASTGLPAWWLGYLAMMARPASANGNPALEWYPPGRLVLWCAACAVLVIGLGMFTLGTDAESFRSGLRRSLEQIIRIAPDSAAEVKTTQSSLIDLMVGIIPLAAAVIATITNVLNLWLAARIVKFSGRLNRPWPDLAALSFPRSTLAAFVAVIVLVFAGGIIGIFASAGAAALTIAYGVLGFAVLHAITRTTRARGFLLGAAYGAVIVFGWPVLAVCMLGVSDALFDIRGRTARKRRPPTIT